MLGKIAGSSAALLLLAGLAGFGGCSHKSDTDSMNMKSGDSMKMDQPTTQASATTYTCTMHPDVVSDKPGKCPKCGMDLVAKK